jgi:hypothetical protein
MLDLLFVSMWLWEWLKTLGDQRIWVKKLNLDVQKLWIKDLIMCNFSFFMLVVFDTHASIIKIWRIENITISKSKTLVIFCWWVSFMDYSNATKFLGPFIPIQNAKLTMVKTHLNMFKSQLNTYLIWFWMCSIANFFEKNHWS